MTLADHLQQHRAAWDRTDATERDDRKWQAFYNRHIESVSRLPPCRTERDARAAVAELVEHSRGKNPMFGDATKDALLRRLLAFHSRPKIKAAA
jgi:hypothetical protein